MDMQRVEKQKQGKDKGKQSLLEQPEVTSEVQQQPVLRLGLPEMLT